MSIKFNNFSTDIPVKRNFLTTISGNILTDGNNVKVDIQDAFENADNLEDEPYYVEIWDGKTIKVPAQNEAGNYVIEREGGKDRPGDIAKAIERIRR